MQSNKQMYLYVLALTSVMGIVLAGLFQSLKDITAENRANAKKASILSCVMPDVKNPGQIFDERMTILAYHPKSGEVFTEIGQVNAARQSIAGLKPYRSMLDIDLAYEEKVPEADRVYPFYQFKQDNGDLLKILSIRGNGLWDKIWAYVAIDKNKTIQGIFFDHKAETPGLGAEIKDSERFKAQFKGLKVMDKDNRIAPMAVQKRSIKKPDHEVMGISGATITCDGVTEMLRRGIGVYESQLLAFATK